MVSGDRLEAQNLEQLSDYAAYLPGLNLDSGGNPSFNLVLLRGIYPLTNASAVAFYIDDSPVGTTGAVMGNSRSHTVRSGATRSAARATGNARRRKRRGRRDPVRTQ